MNPLETPSPQSSPWQGEEVAKRQVRVDAVRAVWWFIGAITIIRLSILWTSDLEFDEAHYWMWSERLAPAYFSKGPGVAFAMRASTAIFGANEFGVRFWSPILAAGTSLLVFYFARKLFSESAGFWGVIALNLTPIFNIGSFVMTIDPLSIFFWMAAMFACWLALEHAPNFSWWWPITGLCVGLGFLCKYTNAFEFMSILVVIALTPRWRDEFKRPGLYSALGIFALCTIPPLVWNSQHAWVTLGHLRSRGGLDEGIGIHPTELLKFIGEHFLAYSPLLFLAIAWAVIASWPRVRQQFRLLFLFSFGAPVFIFYFLLSINKAAAPNWDALGILSFGILALSFWRERLETNTALRTFAAIALALGLIISLFALDTDLLRTLGFRFSRSDPADRMRGWKSATSALEKLRGETEAKIGEKVFLIADERGRASEISFYLRDKRLEGPGHPPVYLVESQDLSNQFSFWPRYDEFEEAPANAPKPEGDVYTEEKGINLFEGRSALYIRDGERGRLPRNISAAFQNTEPLGTIRVERYGKIIRTWQIFLCRNYHPLPL